jgi:hypothetical protein
MQQFRLVTVVQAPPITGTLCIFTKIQHMVLPLRLEKQAIPAQPLEALGVKYWCM